MYRKNVWLLISPLTLYLVLSPVAAMSAYFMKSMIGKLLASTMDRYEQLIYSAGVRECSP